MWVVMVMGFYHNLMWNKFTKFNSYYFIQISPKFVVWNKVLIIIIIMIQSLSGLWKDLHAEI